MTTADCPPLADRITKSLLGYGVIAGPIYVVAVAAQMLTRDGYDPTRHAASQLVNGSLGWIQIATFLVVRRDDHRRGGRYAPRARAGSFVGVGLGAGCGATVPAWSPRQCSAPIPRTASRRAHPQGSAR